MTEANDTLNAADELDLSGDSAVEIVTANWTIQEISHEETDSDNGKGNRATIVFESDAWPYPITMRFFTSYESKSGKSTDWVKRSRGQLKNILKAATGQTNLGAALDPDSPDYAVSKVVQATTKDGGDGFAVLSRFKKVAA
jgi:hypothetical protein